MSCSHPSRLKAALQVRELGGSLAAALAELAATASREAVHAAAARTAAKALEAAQAQRRALVRPQLDLAAYVHDRTTWSACDIKP